MSGAAAAGRPVFKSGHFYRTRDGAIAFVETIGPDGKLHGKIRGGIYRKTWWEPNGSHNTFPSDDLMEEVKP